MLKEHRQLHPFCKNFLMTVFLLFKLCTEVGKLFVIPPCFGIGNRCLKRSNSFFCLFNLRFKLMEVLLPFDLLGALLPGTMVRGCLLYTSRCV